MVYCKFLNSHKRLQVLKFSNIIIVYRENKGSNHLLLIVVTNKGEKIGTERGKEKKICDGV